MALKYFSFVLVALFAFWVIDLVHPAQTNDFECYSCKHGQGEECSDSNEECLSNCQEEKDSCTMSRPVCEIEVKDYGGDVYVKKRCRQEEACSNQVAKNVDECYNFNTTEPVAGCTYCCNETLCNYNMTSWYDYRTGDASSLVAGRVTFSGFLLYLMFHRF
ncbi:uncharacterized protein LOC144440199 [Glandiceps talaboti]